MSNWDELQRQARLGRKILAAALLIAAVGLCVGLAQDKPAEPKPQPEQPAKTPVARGVVFDDKNGNGTRDKDEPGLPGVRVSNQHQVTVTDQQGTWELPHDDDTTFFVIKPRGWRTPQDADNLPRFFYHHRPKGSPALRLAASRPPAICRPALTSRWSRPLSPTSSTLSSSPTRRPTTCSRWTGWPTMLCRN